MIREKTCRAVIGVLALGAVSTGASAAMVTFTIEAAGAGTLDGQAFAKSNFVITLIGDTDNRYGPGGPSIFGIVNDSASIAIDGLGAFDFSIPIWIFTSPDLGFSGIGRNGPGNLTGFDNPALVGWDLLSSIGPLVDQTGDLLQWTNDGGVQTSGGVLIFNTTQTPMTFTARVVPAPATMALCGLAGAAVARRRRA